MHGVLLKASESQHARPLPKGSSANSWSSYLLLNDEEESDCHEGQCLGPFGMVHKWVQTSPLWGRRGLADTCGHQVFSTLGSSITDHLVRGWADARKARPQASISERGMGGIGGMSSGEWRVIQR